MADFLEIAQFHQLPCEQSHTPALISLWCRTTGDCQQMGFLLSIHFPLLWPFWLGTPIERILQPLLQKTPTNTPHCWRTDPKCFPKLLIRPVWAFLATIDFEQDLRMLHFAC